MSKKTVVFDFDGVIHSYTSGWRGVSVVPDPVVPGIQSVIKALRDDGYEVVVVSTRCARPEGRGAVRRYLRDNHIEVDDVMATKPPAICYVDDRAICFDGHAERLIDQIHGFQPWNHICGNCVWHIPSNGGFVCSNEDSIYYGEEMRPENRCEGFHGLN